MNSVYGDRLLTCRIAPFGHPRIKARLQLPEAFRSLPRPSSAPSAKAFTLWSCSLDHYAILWFSFSAIVVSLPNISISKTILLLSQLLSLFNFQCAGGAARFSAPHPAFCRAARRWWAQVDSNHRPHDPLLARQVLSHLSYTPTFAGFLRIRLPLRILPDPQN